VAAKNKREKLVIGSAEHVDLPEFGVKGLRAKVDTGARSSALHVENIEMIGQTRVRFDIRLHRKHAERRVVVEAKITRQGRVRPSSGHGQTRLFVSTPMRIGSVEKEVELSLVDRERMIFRMLVGRTALADDFLVDPSRRYLLTERRRKKKKKKKRKALAGPASDT
jgi:hypothetical protein